MNEGIRFDIALSAAQAPHMSEADVFGAALRSARTAEDLGYQGAWLLEQHFTRYSLCSSPLVMASFLLGMTNRLRVGSAVSVIPLDHPLRIAEQVALVDRLSGGRFDFGIGRGAGAMEFPVFDVDLETNHLAMREWTDIILRAWKDDLVSADSELVKFPPVPVYPKPVATPHPPIYVASESPSTIEWVASRGYPMLLSYWLEKETVISQLELYNSFAESFGYDPGAIDHVAACIAYVADSRQEAVEAVWPHLHWWRKTAEDVFFELEELRRVGNYEFHRRKWEEGILRSQMSGSAGADEDDSLTRLLELSPVGTADDCIQRMQDFIQETGIRHFMCGFDGPGEVTRSLRAMQRFATEVAPHLRPRFREAERARR